MCFTPLTNSNKLFRKKKVSKQLKVPWISSYLYVWQWSNEHFVKIFETFLSFIIRGYTALSAGFLPNKQYFPIVLNTNDGSCPHSDQLALTNYDTSLAARDLTLTKLGRVEINKRYKSKGLHEV